MRQKPRFTRVKVVLQKKKDPPTYKLTWRDPISGIRRQEETYTNDLDIARLMAAERWKVVTYGDNLDFEPITWAELADLINKERKEFCEPIRDFSRVAAAVRKYGEHQNAIAATTPMLRGVLGNLLQSGLSKSTVKKYAQDMQFMLNWAYDHDKMLRPVKVPHVNIKTKKLKQMRCKPVTYQQHIAVCEQLLKDRPRHGQQFVNMLWLIWHTGLRLADAQEIGWNDSLIVMNMDVEFPRMEFYAEGHKNDTDDLTPLTPEAIDFINETWPADKREGKLIQLRYEKPHQQVMWHKSKRKYVPRILDKHDAVIDAIETASRAVGATVNFANQETKFASAHDWRRAFATRMASKYPVTVVKRLMRHQSYVTTEQFYTFQECDEIAKQLRRTE